MRVAWMTDIHLDFIGPDEIKDLAQQVKLAEVEKLFITGDISNAINFEKDLGALLDHLPPGIETYYVLGNHDFYGISISEMHNKVRSWGRGVYLSESPVQLLSETTALVGVDGWADARAGYFAYTPIELRDRRHVWDLKKATNKVQLGQIMNALGDAEAEKIRASLSEALQLRNRVYVLTHVPPWIGAAWHEGSVSDPMHSPYFCCLAVGEAILEVANLHPKKQVTVLCGHTHSPGVYQAAENVRVLTGKSLYGQPGISEVLEIG